MSHPPQQTHAGYNFYPLIAIPSTEDVPLKLHRAADDKVDDVARPLVALFAPRLAHLPGDTIRKELFTASAQFLAGLSAVHVPQTVQRNLLPFTFTLPVPQLNSNSRDSIQPIYPSHVLAVSPPPASSRQTPIDAPVALVAVHGAIIAANCTNVPLPTAATQPSDARFINLAAHRLTVPSVPAFVILRLYMYGRRIDTFLDAILPFPAPFIKRLKPDSREPEHASLKLTAAFHSANEVRRLAEHLIHCTPGGAYPMWDRLRLVENVWATMMELGMHELLLWEALDLAWQVARYALHVVTQQHGKALAAVAAAKERQGR
ncbi:hypothetical protein B0H19DRAFT_1247866 [Mycena capillaripes]|nr:hypothetical protein B0H19DRAFT_1247866 [Mycena capillaripes]